MKLKDFPLAWRWTDENYALLPEHVLTHITPQDNEHAARLFEKNLSFCDADGLDEKQFSLTKIATKDIEPKLVSEWLISHFNNTETVVFLSWQPDTAISTTWGIFSQYWSEFCYPSSDDVIILSETESWMLLYHHEEFFQFGSRV